MKAVLIVHNAAIDDEVNDAQGRQAQDERNLGRKIVF